MTVEGRGDVTPPRSGVCIVRVETQEDRLLISVTTERELRRGLATAGGREMHHYADAGSAVKEVERFLRSHTPHASRPRGRDARGDGATDAG